MTRASHTGKTLLASDADLIGFVLNGDFKFEGGWKNENIYF